MRKAPKAMTRSRAGLAALTTWKRQKEFISKTLKFPALIFLWSFFTFLAVLSGSIFVEIKLFNKHKRKIFKKISLTFCKSYVETWSLLLWCEQVGEKITIRSQFRKHWELSKLCRWWQHRSESETWPSAKIYPPLLVDNEMWKVLQAVEIQL